MKPLMPLRALPFLLVSLCGAQTASVDFSALLQEIDGLGASSAWHGILNSKELDAAFSNANSNQLGLSILRVDIDPGGQARWASQKTNAVAAKARGAKYVLGTPWSPPASMKSNNSTTGGELKASSYAEYASYLKSYRDYMGTALDVVSIQNEPNIKVDYVSCDWTAAQLYGFVKNNSRAIGGSVMMPETFNYDLSYSDPVLNDAAAVGNITHVGLHLYGAQMKTYTNAVNKGKKIWMTEYYYNPDDIGTALSMGKQIMDCFNNGMNAYIWWYLRMPDCNLINSDGSVKLKGHVMGQLSKFVRPGYHRATATYAPQTGVTLQAFAGDRNVIVVINQATTSKSQVIRVSGGNFSGYRRYTTSSTKRIVDVGAQEVPGGQFTIELEPQSITTLVASVATTVRSETMPRGGFRQDGKRVVTDGDRLDLRDLGGRLLRSARGNPGSVELGLDGLRSGLYRATDGQGSIPVVVVTGP